MVIGRIEFLVVVGWRSPISCWLPTRDCSQLLEAPHDVLPSPALTQHSSSLLPNQQENLSDLEILF